MGAALEDKTSTYFKSRAIICTTNMDNIEAKSLTCSDALRRRIEYNFEVIAKGGRRSVTKDIHPDDYTYRLKNRGTVRDYCANEVLTILKDDLKTKEERFERLKKNYESMDATPTFSPAMAVSDEAKFEPRDAPEGGAQYVGDLVDNDMQLADKTIWPSLPEIDVDRAASALDTIKQSMPTGQMWGPIQSMFTLGDYFYKSRVVVEDYFIACSQEKATHYGKFNDKEGSAYVSLGPALTDTRRIEVYKTTDALVGTADVFCKKAEGNTSMGIGMWFALISALWGLLKLVVHLYFTYFGPPAGHKDCLTHAHEGLAIGSIVEHQHACESCQTKFKHKHRIVHPTKSVTYGPNLCRNCAPTHARLLETYQPSGVFIRENPRSQKQKEDYGKEVNSILATMPPEVVEHDDRVLPNFSPLWIEDRDDLVLKQKGDVAKRIENHEDVTPVPPTVKLVESYEGGATRKPPTKKIHTSDEQAYDAGATRRPPTRNIHTTEEKKTLEMMNSVHAFPKYIFEVARRMADGENDFPTTRYTHLNDENRSAIDEILGTAHVDRLDMHRSMVYEAYVKNAPNFPSLTTERVIQHDMSKFELSEMIAYTLKFHDEDEAIWQKFLDKGFKKEEKEKIWQSGLERHYLNNGHHPNMNPDRENQMDLEEAICDMVAVGAEKAGKPIPNDFSEYASYVMAKDGLYLERFNE